MTLRIDRMHDKRCVGRKDLIDIGRARGIFNQDAYGSRLGKRTPSGKEASKIRVRGIGRGKSGELFKDHSHLGAVRIDFRDARTRQQAVFFSVLSDHRHSFRSQDFAKMVCADTGRTTGPRRPQQRNGQSIGLAHNRRGNPSQSRRDDRARSLKPRPNL